MALERIVVWRHGRTSSNANGRFQGQQDVPLDAVGSVEVSAAAQILAMTLAQDAATNSLRIISSDLQRAMATAQTLGDRLNIGVVADENLRERHLGEWEGMTRAEVQRQYPDQFQRWTSGKDLDIGGGETGAQVWERVENSVREHISHIGSGTLVIVSHGAALRGLIIRLLGLPDVAGRHFEIMDTAAWSVLRQRGDGWALNSYNNSAR